MHASGLRVISLISGGTGDSVSVAMALRELFPSKMRVLLVEFSCMGFPQLAHHLPDTYPLHMDRWLLELDHHPGAAVSPYLTSTSGYDLLAVPADQPIDQPIITKVREQPTLVMAPLEIRQQLQHTYDVMIWCCQGNLIHPMTYSALRVSDAIVWTGRGSAEERTQVALFRYLQTECGISPARLYEEGKLQEAAAQLFQPLASMQPIHPFQPASEPDRFSPQTYRFIPRASEEASDPSILFLTAPEDEPSGQLTFGLSTESPLLFLRPSQDMSDLQLYLQVKQLLCEKGMQSANRLVSMFGVRRNRVLLILQQLAAEGMIETMGKGRSYGMKWTPHQCKTYLAHTQPVPAPVPKVTRG